MSRLRPILGVLAGLMLVASAFAHSLLGWTALSGQLRATAAPPALVTGLMIGWQFAGMAMLVFGVSVIWTFAQRLRGRPTPLLPSLVLAIAYLLFGIWAMLASDMDPFFTIFILPGLFLAIASYPATAAPAPTARSL